ncbi:heme-binding HmuY-like protein [Chitinophaga dinghuensis]|uniref:Heme-binding HmuY-like protein n=1 Tax=Chitinophaga dinghuensis TaxID=1539050 RepID=A0A327VW12_9BACT|nr:HmuY family protein [Chitinophaga dinghuensis]RAJ80191.1 heme-binding HmuY-like protein [Chitinophaga dinghuensis]
MQLKQLITLSAGLVFFAACKKKDTAYTPPSLSEGTMVAGMGASYDSTVFVDLSTGKMTAVAAGSWDIAVQSRGGKAIISNGAKKAGIYRIPSANFDSVVALPATASGIKINYENTSLDVTATSVGAWTDNQGKSKQLVYIIDLGKTPPSGANSNGYMKFSISDATASQVTIRYANLDGSNPKSQTITLDATTNFTYFSLMSGKTVQVEPSYKNWDFMCTGVTVAGGGPPGSYVVTMAVLHNRLAGVKVAVDNPAADLASSDDPAAPVNNVASSKGRYGTLTRADFLTLGPVEKADAIGKSWWQILQPHAAGNYKVYDWKTFLLSDADGKLFKIRFTAFKSLVTGTPGYPAFEYKELN